MEIPIPCAEFIEQSGGVEEGFVKLHPKGFKDGYGLPGTKFYFANCERCPARIIPNGEGDIEIFPLLTKYAVGKCTTMSSGGEALLRISE